MQRFKYLINLLHQSPIHYLAFCKIFNAPIKDFSLLLNMCFKLGIPLEIINEYVYLRLKDDIKNTKFCFVDIETTCSNFVAGDLLEIGALNFIKGRVVERLEYLVKVPFIPPEIEKLTGINMSFLEHAVSNKEALKAFKSFIGDGIFVAHNVDFDFGFLNKKLESFNMLPMLNIKICTQALARRTLISDKYSLEYLLNFFNIDNYPRHRAYSDAKGALEIFKLSTKDLINTSVEELINLSKSNIKSTQITY